MSMPGMTLSQLGISTTASNACAETAISTESAMTSRLGERVAHARVVHRDAVADADGGDLERRAAGHVDAGLHGVGDLVEHRGGRG